MTLYSKHIEISLVIVFALDVFINLVRLVRIICEQSFPRLLIHVCIFSEIRPVKTAANATKPTVDNSSKNENMKISGGNFICGNLFGFLANL